MTNNQWDCVWLNGTIATMDKNAKVPYGLIESGALAIQGGKIVWLGNTEAIPKHALQSAKEVYDLQGKCISPTLIDCHTHLVYAGNRSHEFALRLQGQTYAEIAKAGGGIRSTVTATRAASEEELLQQSLPRARALMAEGVSVIEIKSGYGLDLATEIKILWVAKRIATLLPVTTYCTFLGAHTLPVEYEGRADDYVNFVCEEMIPFIAKENLAEAVDVFCETVGFNLTQTEKVFATAKKYGLKIKCHAEQLSNSGAAKLAASYQALSVDHLEYFSAEDIESLKASGTVAVLLPGAYYFLNEKQKPPIELFRANDVPMAVASDCNPGTSPITSILTILNMSCCLFRLTPEEALAGATRNAALALGLQDSIGTLAINKKADFNIWNINHPDELSYSIGFNPLFQRIKHGEIV